MEPATGQVPLIEDTGLSSGSTGQQQVSSSSGTQPDEGPSLTLQTGGGQEIVLDSEDLLLYLSILQTVLILVVTIQEIRS